MCSNELRLPSGHTSLYSFSSFSLDASLDVPDHLVMRPLHFNPAIIELEQLLCLVP